MVLKVLSKLLCVLLILFIRLDSTKGECTTDEICVTCEPETIYVILPYDVIKNYDKVPYHQHFFFSNKTGDSCVAQPSGYNSFKMSLSLDSEVDCGTVKQTSEKLRKYENTIYFYSTLKDEIIPIKNITCLYNGAESVKVIPSHKSSHETQTGHKASLQIFRDPFYSDLTNINLMPFPSLKNKFSAYVQIKFEPRLDFVNQIRVDKCYASSPFENHTFFDNSCISDNDATVEIVESTQDHYRWKFDMFKFKYYVTRVNYITCIMTSCETAEKCATIINNQTCSNTTTNQHSDFKLSYGPYFLDLTGIFSEVKSHNDEDVAETLEYNRNLNSTEQDGAHLRQAAIAAGVVSGTFFLVAMAAIVHVVRQKCHVVFRPSISFKEDRIQPGFAFVLRSSNDVPLVDFENGDPNNQKNYNSLK